MRFMLQILVFLTTVLVLGCGTTDARGRILAYDSNVVIAASGEMDVTETIRVRSDGSQIRHGITRDFPTRYRDRYGNRVNIDFEFLGATVDSRPSDWRSEQHGNGMRVYVGDAQRLLPPGEHDFVLHYRVNRQIGFFDDHDELFWNAVGTGWDFPIDKATARITLPQPVTAGKLQAFGYAGSRDANERNISTRILDDGASYAITAPLKPHQGVSVVLEFPKGIVSEPGTAGKLANLARDNRSLLVGFIGLLLLWIYYLLAWHRHGRDPEAGPLVARYQPPRGFSAAAMRYIRQMGFDNTVFSAGVLDLAARGMLDIEQTGRKKYLARRNDSSDASGLPDDLRALFDALFRDGPTVDFKQENHRRIGKARTALQEALNKHFHKKFFNTHTLLLVPGLVITIATAWLSLDHSVQNNLFLFIWISIWTVITAVLIMDAWQKQVASDKFPVTAWAVAMLFAVANVLVIYLAHQFIGLGSAVVLVALLLTNIAFYQWMKAPTNTGRKVLDKIAGFRWYLGVAEQQELDSRYRPDASPELFSAYLPHALALGVSNAWTARFTEALTPDQMRAAQPTWYHGSIGAGAVVFTSFASSLSSGFSSAIASSAAAPGSSSGASGGVGGGGGGGGGGGW